MKSLCKAFLFYYISLFNEVCVSNPGDTNCTDKVLNELFELLKKPYDEQPNMEKWFAKRPNWALEKVGCSMLSCSS